MGLQFANVTKDRKDLFNALAQAYAEIYIPAFPDQNERESLEQIHDLMSGAVPGVQAIVNIAGNNLTSNGPDRVVKGIAVAYHFNPAHVGLLAYNAVCPKAKGEGIGKILVHSRIESMKQLSANQNASLRGVFVECHDPARFNATNDVMDPNARIRLFQSWGAREVPFNYVQPPLDAHLDYCDNMTLFNYPVDGKYAGPQEAFDFVKAQFNKALPNFEHDRIEHYRNMMQELAAWRANAANDNTPQKETAPLLDKAAVQSLKFV
ncbi:hypothetical protein [Micavibrio aeruginosavorus]|uniref:hypothetical protein n=1 Tax=Micavibrio aeruginosavorus TaxID=349221 RepID=UPI003F4A8B2A